MCAFKKLIVIMTLAACASPVLALPSIRPELTTPANAGAVSADELGPLFSHPLPEEPSAPIPPKVEAKQPQKNDILSLFQDDKPKPEEINPLEEQAKNELKSLEEPQNPASAQQPLVQIDDSKQPDVTIQAENAPKEVELDSINPDSKNLPRILR